MSFLSAIGSWLRAHARVLIEAAGLVALIVFALVTMRAIWAETPPDNSVVEEWNDTILSLGIEPVFPPEEDLYVGDLLAVVVNDRRPGKSAKSQPLLNRAIKIQHLNLDDDLVDNYKVLPIFPDTTKRPTDDADPWLQAGNPDGVFTLGGKRSTLTIAAFPGFTIRHQRAATGGASAALGALFGASRQDSDNTELKIPSAETYGIPSLLASYRLKLFCADPFTRNICTDDTLRRQLSFVTPGLYDTDVDPKTGKRSYLVDIELALVMRVYLTRSIEEARTLSLDQAATLKAAIADAAKKQSPAEPKAAPAGGAAPPPNAAVEQSEKKLEDMLRQLDPSVSGGSLAVSSGWDQRFELKQTFQRPVTIGYRAVRQSFQYDLDHQNNLLPGQQ